MVWAALWLATKIPEEPNFVCSWSIAMRLKQLVIWSFGLIAIALNMERLSGQTVEGAILFLTTKVNGTNGTEFQPGDTLSIYWSASVSNESGQTITAKLTTKVTEKDAPFAVIKEISETRTLLNGEDYVWPQQDYSWTSGDVSGYTCTTSLMYWTNPHVPVALDAETKVFLRDP
jgi:hypothetical protein